MIINNSSSSSTNQTITVTPKTSNSVTDYTLYMEYDEDGFPHQITFDEYMENKTREKIKIWKQMKK
jgi:hypothetical protein